MATKNSNPKFQVIHTLVGVVSTHRTLKAAVRGLRAAERAYGIGITTPTISHTNGPDSIVDNDLQVVSYRSK